MSANRLISISSPAKINLGLEIVGRRADGFHDLCTLMSMIELHDEVTITKGGASHEIEGVPAESNLISIALAQFRAAVPDAPELGWKLVKRIPTAAGLGGASGNAASALVAANTLLGHPLPIEQLTRIAAAVGSDVPFFLGSPAAVAEGVGNHLTPVSLPVVEVLLIVPRLSIPAKTKTLYNALTPNDFTKCQRAYRVAADMSAKRLPATGDLHNAFLRPLLQIAPRLSRLVENLHAVPGITMGLTGAGPSSYVLQPSDSQLEAIATVCTSHNEHMTLIRTAIRTRPLAVSTE